MDVFMKQVKSGYAQITSRFSELFASAWTLLSDTDAFLSRTSVFHLYEADLKKNRADLWAASRDQDAQKKVRDRIVDLRRSLRLQGYDLSLTGFDLEVRGFRNDASISEGFRRLVMACDERKILIVTGESNHLELHSRLEEDRRTSGTEPGTLPHFLWYRWMRKTLELSGSDSESAENFDLFRDYCAVPENRLRIIAAMKRLP